MDSRKIALLVETALGAAHDIILELTLDGLPPAPEPDPEVTYGFACAATKPSNAACDADAQPAAVSEDFAAGMAHARRLFAGHEEDRFAKERAEEIDRQDLQRHVEMRLAAMSAAVALTAAGHGTESTIVQAQAIYDFLCFGAVQANLGCATNMELSDELAVRYKLGHGQPDYRSVGSL